MLGNMGLFIVLEMCTGFCQTLAQFLAVRALYGLSMGGTLGVAVFDGSPRLLLT